MAKRIETGNSNPSWLTRLSPGELQLMHDLADIVRRTTLNGRQHTMTADIRQEIERRGKSNLISTMAQAIRGSRRGLKSTKGEKLKI
jgi:hypothetical protein